jgi:hypothetical protein
MRSAQQTLLSQVSENQVIGRIIVELRADGSLKLFSLTDCDEAERLLLLAIRDSVVVGDLWELLA